MPAPKLAHAIANTAAKPSDLVFRCCSVFYRTSPLGATLPFSSPAARRRYAYGSGRGMEL